MNFAIWTSGKAFPSQLLSEFATRNLVITYIMVSDPDCVEEVEATAISYTVPVIPDSPPGLLLEQKKTDVILLLNYKKLISQELIQKQLFINGHNSLLPKYRGLHAFTWALINNEPEVGFTLFIVDNGIDSGEMLSQIKFSVSLDDTINDLFRNGAEMVPSWVAETMLKFSKGQLTPIPQDESKATYICKRTPADGLILWDNTSLNVHNFIRSITPPYTMGAFTFFKGEKIIVCKSQMVSYPDYTGLPGQIVCIKKNEGVLVKTNDNLLLIKEILINNHVTTADKLFRTVGARFQNS